MLKLKPGFGESYRIQNLVTGEVSWVSEPAMVPASVTIHQAHVRVPHLRFSTYCSVIEKRTLIIDGKCAGCQRVIP